MSNLFLVYALIFLGSLSNKKAVHQIIIFILAFFFSTRNESVPDTVSYIYKYDNSFMTLLNENLEFGLSFLSYLCNDLIGFSFQTFLFLLTFILLEIWYFTTIKLFPKGDIGRLFLLFMSYYGFFYLGIALGNAIALMICYVALAIILLKKKHALLWCIALISAGILFHKSSVLFFLIIPFLKINISKRMITIWLCISVLLLFTSSMSILNNILSVFESYSEDYKEYSNYSEEKGGSFLTITLLMDIVIIATVIYGRSFVEKSLYKIYDFYLKMVMIGFSLYCMFWKLTGVTRLSGLFFFYSFILFYMLIQNSATNYSKDKRTVLTIYVSFFYFFVLVYSQSGLLAY